MDVCTTHSYYVTIQEFMTHEHPWKMLYMAPIVDQILWYDNNYWVVALGKLKLVYNK